jgi:hypothetical protein
MLSVHCPDLCRAEQHWIVSVLLGDFLGLAHEIRFDDKDTVRIAADGKTLELPAIFVHRAHGHWLSAKTMPAEPLPRWRAPADHFPRAAVGPALPLIFGSGTFERRDNEAVLGLDVFGAGFFMLSRYEEAVSARRDSHQRFPSAASLACREGFLERPIVDEYTEILWLAMQSLWPRLQRRQRRFTTAVTCDVDHPYHASARSLFRLFKRTAGEALRKRTWADGCRPLRNYFGSRKGNWSHDPYYHTVDWMMDVNEAAGNKVSFYFIPEVTDAALDDTCPITEPAVAAMLKRIADRGHEIGIHPGYRTYQDKQRLLAGLYRLREVLHRQRITQPGRRRSPALPALVDAHAGDLARGRPALRQHARVCGPCRVPLRNQSRIPDVRPASEAGARCQATAADMHGIVGHRLYGIWVHRSCAAKDEGAEKRGQGFRRQLHAVVAQLVSGSA